MQQRVVGGSSVSCLCRSMISVADSTARDILIVFTMGAIPSNSWHDIGMLTCSIRLRGAVGQQYIMSAVTVFAA